MAVRRRSLYGGVTPPMRMRSSAAKRSCSTATWLTCTRWPPRKSTKQYAATATASPEISCFSYPRLPPRNSGLTTVSAAMAIPPARAGGNAFPTLLFRPLKTHELTYQTGGTRKCISPPASRHWLRAHGTGANFPNQPMVASSSKMTSPGVWPGVPWPRIRTSSDSTLLACSAKYNSSLSGSRSPAITSVGV